MRVGIDSYCFHRYFGDLWPGVDGDPGKRWRVSDFVGYARELHVAGVSLETCFMPALDRGFLAELKSSLDDGGLDRVLAWGHPDGLEGGTSGPAFEDLIQHIPSAGAIGTSTMRIVASLMHYSPELEESYSRDLVPVLREATRVAADHGVVLGLENHGDFTADSLLRLIGEVDSPNLKVTLDTGNALRVLEDPVEAARKLAPHTVATHIKDVTTGRGSPWNFLFWPATPVGQGAIDIPAILAILRDAGYTGLLCVEVDNPAPSWRRLPEEELVRQSVEFIRSWSAQSGARPH